VSVETLLYTALKSLASNRVYRDIAPAESTALPRITFQQVGGDAINFLSGDIPSMKRARIQINCWDDRRDDVMALMREVEDTMRSASGLHATVLGAAVALYEEDTGLYGAMQDFSVAYDD
jgi:hypothetical protein